ncbi:MAG: response regulator [Planctomycetota bacterium]
MLVLSRRADDSIRLPELDITIEVLGIRGKTVRVGIDAPVEVKVLRGELEEAPDITDSFVVNGQSEHEIRNKLNSLNIAVALAKKLIQKGKPELAKRRIESVLADLNPPDNDSVSLSVLLVEDVANERELLADLLRLHNYQVETVSDGIETLEYLQSNQTPDIILMDMLLPKLNGSETIKKIRQNRDFDSIQIFAVSGTNPNELGLDLIENRINQWFTKPVQTDKLVSAVEQASDKLSAA